MEGKAENGGFISKKNPKTIFISQANPAVNKILRQNSYRISFELDSLSESTFETTSIKYLEKDDVVEVVE